MDEAGIGVWRSIHGNGYFRERIWGAIVTNGDFTASVCDSASTVGAAVWGGACGGPRHCCIWWGPTSFKEKGTFWGFLFPIFTMGNAVGSPTVKCFRFVCENFTSFPFGKRIVWRYIQFQGKRWDLWEISKNVTIAIRKLQPTQQRCRGITCIFMNERHGPLAHPARLRMLAAARCDATLSPNYFGKACLVFNANFIMSLSLVLSIYDLWLWWLSGG